MKQSVAFVVLACWIGFAAPQGKEPQGKQLKFYWAAQVATGRGASSQYATVKPDETQLKLASGDRLQFYFSPEGACFAYIMSDAPGNRLRLLFPEGDQLGRAIDPGAGRYVPSRSGWFRLDDQPGDERVYLLVGLERLLDLEQAWVRYEKAADGERAAARLGVLDEISKARKAHGSPQPSPSRPIALTGRLRAGERDLAAEAQPVSSPGFFARTYVLEHRQ